RRCGLQFIDANRLMRGGRPLEGELVELHRLAGSYFSEAAGVIIDAVDHQVGATGVLLYFHYQAEGFERLGIAAYGDRLTLDRALLDLDRLDLDLVVCGALDDGLWGKVLAHRDEAAGQLSSLQGL